MSIIKTIRSFYSETAYMLDNSRTKLFRKEFVEDLKKIRIKPLLLPGSVVDYRIDPDKWTVESVVRALQKAGWTVQDHNKFILYKKYGHIENPYIIQVKKWNSHVGKYKSYKEQMDDEYTKGSGKRSYDKKMSAPTKNQKELEKPVSPYSYLKYGTPEPVLAILELTSRMAQPKYTRTIDKMLQDVKTVKVQTFSPWSDN